MSQLFGPWGQVAQAIQKPQNLNGIDRRWWIDYPESRDQQMAKDFLDKCLESFFARDTSGQMKCAFGYWEMYRDQFPVFYGYLQALPQPTLLGAQVAKTVHVRARIQKQGNFQDNFWSSAKCARVGVDWSSFEQYFRMQCEQHGFKVNQHKSLLVVKDLGQYVLEDLISMGL